MRRIAACLVAALAVAAGSLAATGPRDVERALGRHLRARDLPARWVRCVAMPQRVARQVVFRCNVNFGDPHVQIYCAALVRGRLLAAEWVMARQGRQDRQRSARECAARLARLSSRG